MSYVVSESHVSPEGLKVAVLDSERQRVAAARRAVELNIQKIMIEQIAPLIAKRDLLDQRESVLDLEIAPLLEKLVYRNSKGE
jgi:hypothetical protein